MNELWCNEEMDDNYWVWVVSRKNQVCVTCQFPLRRDRRGCETCEDDEWEPTETDEEQMIIDKISEL